jgi:hypothetical protein
MGKKQGFHRAVGQFYVLEQLSKPVSLKGQTLTYHYKNDRGARIKEVSTEDVTPLYSFIVDTGHPNGNEIHTITDRAEIVIQNEETKKVVTVLFARPAQVKRYWKHLSKNTPKDEDFNLVLKFAKSNLDRNLNNL